MEEHTKYFPAKSLPFWDKMGCFSGIWEEVKTGQYLPIVVVDGENLGTDGAVEEAVGQPTRSYMISGHPREAVHIATVEHETYTELYWKDDAGIYYYDILGVMEVERWFQELQRKEQEKKWGRE